MLLKVMETTELVAQMEAILDFFESLPALQSVLNLSKLHLQYVSLS